MIINIERANLISEWLEHLRNALRFGNTHERAAQKADVLTFGTVQKENQ